MTTGAGVTPIRCRNLGSPDEIRARGRCFLISGIVIIVIGVALLAVSFATLSFIIGPSVVLIIWGFLCLVIAWKRFELAKYVENNNTHVPTATISGVMTAGSTTHPTVTVFQQTSTTTTTGNTYGFQQQQFSTPYPSQFAAGPPAYSPEVPPYSAYNAYSNPTGAGAPPPPPPSYTDVTAKSGIYK